MQNDFNTWMTVFFRLIQTTQLMDSLQLNLLCIRNEEQKTLLQIPVGQTIMSVMSCGSSNTAITVKLRHEHKWVTECGGTWGSGRNDMELGGKTLNGQNLYKYYSLLHPV
jgi:hypothetical protein